MFPPEERGLPISIYALGPMVSVDLARKLTIVWTDPRIHDRVLAALRRMEMVVLDHYDSCSHQLASVYSLHTRDLCSVSQSGHIALTSGLSRKFCDTVWNTQSPKPPRSSTTYPPSVSFIIWAGCESWCRPKTPRKPLDAHSLDRHDYCSTILSASYSHYTTPISMVSSLSECANISHHLSLPRQRSSTLWLCAIRQTGTLLISLVSIDSTAIISWSR